MGDGKLKINLQVTGFVGRFYSLNNLIIYQSRGFLILGLSPLSPLSPLSHVFSDTKITNLFLQSLYLLLSTSKYSCNGRKTEHNNLERESDRERETQRDFMSKKKKSFKCELVDVVFSSSYTYPSIPLPFIYIHVHMQGDIHSFKRVLNSYIFALRSTNIQLQTQKPSSINANGNGFYCAPISFFSFLFVFVG